MELPHQHTDRLTQQMLLEQMPTDADFSELCNLFRLLNDPHRLQLFWILYHTEECVINLSAMLELTSPALSHHLKILKDGGLLQCRRDGREVYYRVAQQPRTLLIHDLLEAMLGLSCPAEADSSSCEHETGAHCDETIHAVHRYLVTHLDQRCSIEALAHRFLMNPTTLKARFKACYGCSIAAHIKLHRMEAAAKLLQDTSLSVGEIAQSVGYESQSKFTQVFREQYGQTPLAYRKAVQK